MIITQSQRRLVEEYLWNSSILTSSELKELVRDLYEAMRAFEDDRVELDRRRQEASEQLRLFERVKFKREVFKSALAGGVRASGPGESFDCTEHELVRRALKIAELSAATFFDDDEDDAPPTPSTPKGENT